jgi:uncharacterized membrane protein
MRAERVAEGFVAVIEVVGTQLAEHFPHAAGDGDELPIWPINVQHLGTLDTVHRKM